MLLIHTRAMALILNKKSVPSILDSKYRERSTRNSSTFLSQIEYLPLHWRNENFSSQRGCSGCLSDEESRILGVENVVPRNIHLSYTPAVRILSVRSELIHNSTVLAAVHRSGVVNWQYFFGSWLNSSIFEPNDAPCSSLICALMWSQFDSTLLDRRLE